MAGHAPGNKHFWEVCCGSDDVGAKLEHLSKSSDLKVSFHIPGVSLNYCCPHKNLSLHGGKGRQNLT